MRPGLDLAFQALKGNGIHCSSALYTQRLFAPFEWAYTETEFTLWNDVGTEERGVDLVEAGWYGGVLYFISMMISVL